MNPVIEQKPSVTGYRERIGSVFAGFFGVVLPVGTLAFELVTGMCEEFFDPIPTGWHVAAVALVALANALALHASIGAGVSAARLRWVTALNAFAMGIAAYYALWFVPLLPFAAIGVLFFGLGLLPLSPLLSLVVAVLLRRDLRRRYRDVGFELPRVWHGLLAGVALLLALEVPGAFQVWALKTAANGTQAQQSRALWLLRHVGSEERLLKACYGSREGERSALLEMIFGATSQAERRQVYYRVTGRSYNSVPAPSHLLSLFGRGGDQGNREWVWDDSLGQGNVGQRLKALYLTESRLDGTLDGDAALGYLEWTMVFRNDHEFQQREARALIQLPPGAVVSRLTLWIAGEEREAAFGGRGQVRQAYQAMVSQRRDPVLVTTKGPDRILVQCFPIEPKGGEMKVRLGVTIPLVLDQPVAARLALPGVIEQNYSNAQGLTHAVWIEAASPLSSGLAAYRAETPRAARFALHGSLTPAQFGAASAGLAVARNAAETSAWTPDPRDAGRVFTQEIVRQAPPAGPLAVVIDGSGDMGATAKTLAEALETMPPNFALTLRVAGDDVLLCPAGTPREAAAWLRAQHFAGGTDATAALLAAADSLRPHGGTLLWIHGVQPVTWSDLNALEQALAHRAGPMQLFALAAVAGPNAVLEKLGESAGMTALPRSGDLKGDVDRALQRLGSGGLAAIRRARPAENFVPAGRETSAALARLWAADEVTRLLDPAHPQHDAAVRLAVAARLVTPVTGAVVLETKQQYDAAGLTPGDPEAEAVRVPETAQTLVLLALGIAALLALARRQQGLRRPRTNWHPLKMDVPATTADNG